MDPREFLARSKEQNASRLNVNTNPTRESSQSHEQRSHSSNTYSEESAHVLLENLSHASADFEADEEAEPLTYVQARGPRLASASIGISGAWSSTEDKLLLLGVATSGVGRWTEMREDFLLKRNSAQMNQRFTRLAGRHSVFTELGAQQSDTNAELKFKQLKLKDDYKDVRTKPVCADEEKELLEMLPEAVAEMLENFSEDTIWDSIAIRHIMDSQAQEKRSGRPQKYALPIHIPRHMQHGNWINYRDLIIDRPNEVNIRTEAQELSPETLFQTSDSASIAAALPASTYNRKRGRGRPRNLPEAPGENSKKRVPVATVLLKEKEKQDQLQIGQGQSMMDQGAYIKAGYANEVYNNMLYANPCARVQTYGSVVQNTDYAFDPAHTLPQYSLSSQATYLPYPDLVSHNQTNPMAAIQIQHMVQPNLAYQNAMQSYHLSLKGDAYGYI